MAKITVGGNEFTVAPLSFYDIERAWPCFVKAQATDDPIEATGHFVDFLSVVLSNDTPEFADPTVLKKRLRMSEMANVATAVREILVENEMIAGEAAAPEQPDQAPVFGTATAPASSAS
jgi:hypothetical protein